MTATLRTAATAAFLALQATQSSAQNAEVIDSVDIATRIGDYIVDECKFENPVQATTQEKGLCIAAGVTGAYTIATKVAEYFDAIAWNAEALAKTDTTALRLGVLRAELGQECLTPLKQMGGRRYESTTEQLELSKTTVGECFNFIDDTVKRELGQDLLPTPRNVVAMHLNRIP